MGQLSDVKQIVCDAADNMPCLRIIKVAERLALHMLKELLAHICFYVNPQLMTKVIDDVLETGAEQIDQQQPNADPDDCKPISPRNQCIDEPLNN